jgi:hypothetical protein
VAWDMGAPPAPPAGARGATRSAAKKLSHASAAHPTPAPCVDEPIGQSNVLAVKR